MEKGAQNVLINVMWRIQWKLYKWAVSWTCIDWCHYYAASFSGAVKLSAPAVSELSQNHNVSLNSDSVPGESICKCNK